MGLSKGVAVPQASQSLIKAPVARPPQLHSEMTPQQFRKFVIDWEVFVEMTNLPKARFHNQLYSCASESVQNAIINTRWLKFSQTVGLRYVSHLNDMGFSTDNLIPSQKIVRTVRNFTLVCRGWLPVRSIVEGKETKQAFYICDKVDRIYFSKGTCVDVGILSPVFPHPMPCAESELSELHSAVPPVGTAVSACQPQPSVNLPVRPQCPPYPPTEENVTKLKEWLLDEFATTAFNNEGEFPFLSGPDGRIHLREDAVPWARHAPIPVQFHFKEAVKAGLFKDIERDIIAPVPAGTPTEWCSTMVITPKKDGRQTPPDSWLPVPQYSV